MTKQKLFDELKAIAHHLITEGGRRMNAKRATRDQLTLGRVLVNVGADVQILRAVLFKMIAAKRYRRLRNSRGRGI